MKLRTFVMKLGIAEDGIPERDPIKVTPVEDIRQMIDELANDMEKVKLAGAGGIAPYKHGWNSGIKKVIAEINIRFKQLLEGK